MAQFTQSQSGGLSTPGSALMPDGFGMCGEVSLPIHRYVSIGVVAILFSVSGAPDTDDNILGGIGANTDPTYLSPSGYGYGAGTTSVLLWLRSDTG